VTQIHDLTVLELAAAFRGRELSPVESTDHYLGRIGNLDTGVGAFFTVAAELAGDQARAAEKAIATAAGSAELPPLTGVPIPIKDLNMVAGLRHTYGSAAFEDNVAVEDDHVSGAIRAAGAVITGKTATSEFGMPCYTETAVGPPARTPWDPSRSAGGSSGGAAAAVAAGLAPAAQGNDGGGSIRIPASVCGVFGLKPSRGRISNAPLMPDFVGFTTEGPIARTVADAALLLDVMAGNQPGDMYTQPALAKGETFLAHAGRDPGRLRIGRSLQHPIEGAVLHPDCVAAYVHASRLLRELGHEVEDVVMPFGPDMVPAFETIWHTMATLVRVDAAREDRLLPLTRHLRERGRATSAAALVAAQAYLQIVMRMALPVLNAYDAILTPTLAAPPVPVGYFTEAGPAEDFERQKRFTPFTALYNASGQPAASLPLYWSSEGLPIGVMLGARVGDEATLISLSAQLEVACPWKDRHPPLW
jgi:amidase